MKKLIILLTLLAVSCEYKPEVDENKENVLPMGYTITTFEGHRYLSVYNAGVIHLESCICKK
jgi:hypothetical protein